MCHCIFFGINPRVSKHHAFRLHRATWWQLGLNSKEDICVSLCQLLVKHWQGRPLSDSQQSFTATSSPYGNKCAHRRRSIVDQQVVQQGTVAQVTQGQHPGCIFPLKGKEWLLESLDLGSLCWLIFGGKSTECGKSKPNRVNAPKLSPLRRSE